MVGSGWAVNSRETGEASQLCEGGLIVVEKNSTDQGAGVAYITAQFGSLVHDILRVIGLPNHIVYNSSDVQLCILLNISFQHIYISKE